MSLGLVWIVFTGLELYRLRPVEKSDKLLTHSGERSLT